MVITFRDDEMNLQGRNIKNTDKGEYNCGGYALNLFNWFQPYKDGECIGFFGWFKGKEETQRIMVEYLLENFSLRIVKGIEELKPKEYAVAFRLSEFDFHFVKRCDNGVWRHKRGGLGEIEIMKKEKVFSKSWDGGYDSELILFAVQK